MKIGFDNEKYLKMQSEHIRERIASFGGKLYLEFGGKLYDDYHASRVLPGFEPDSKMRMLQQLSDQAEIVVVVNAADLEEKRVRGDLGITYDLEVMRLIDVFRSRGLYVGSVVLSRFNGQAAAVKFQKHLESLGMPVYRHYPIEGYPSDVAKIVSDEGYGKNEYIETSRSLVVVTAPGASSGKMATCLSQLYQDHKRGIQSGYAKFETFPIWNLSINHPVNVAYEAATADLNDVNMIDPFHLKAYNQICVNYNRDVETFPVLAATFKKIYGSCPYQSPTDMGVNMAGNCIFDDEAVSEASRQEIIRRYFRYLCEMKKDICGENEVRKLEMLMSQLDIDPTEREVVLPARQMAEERGEPAVALQLADGHVVLGHTSERMGASAAVIMNALKYLAGLPRKEHLISPEVFEPIQKLKVNQFGSKNPRLHSDEILIALSICAVHDENARLALEQIDKLRGCDVHSTVILTQVDEGVFRKLGTHLTCEPAYQTQKLYRQ